MDRNLIQLKEEIGGMMSRIADLEQFQNNVLNNQNLTVETPSNNQILNGDFSDSINSRLDSTYTTNNRAYCCIFWYSHNAPTSGQQLYETSDPYSANFSLKNTLNSLYDAAYCDWESSGGYARMQGLKTLDAPFPVNLAVPGRTEEIVFIAARRNSYIELTDTCCFYAGIWDNTSGQRNWISDAFTLTGTVVGTPAGTLERRYRVFVETDKGISYLSDEVVVSGAPDDSSFSNSNVLLRWKSVEGVLRYIVYRYTPSTGIYWKLEEVSNGSLTYIDLNTKLTVETGYPGSTFTARQGLYYTNLGLLKNLAIDGVSAKWDTVPFPVVVPDKYNQTVTTDKQWIRIGLTEAANLLVPGCTTHSNSTVDLPESLLEAAHVGLTVELSDGTNTATRTILAQAGNSLTLSSAIGWSNSITEVRIVGGGFHGVLVDLVHCCYQRGALYSPHSDDVKYRTLQPAAKPNGSNQGGSGTPPQLGGDGSDGSDGGGFRCVVLETPVETPNCFLPISQIEPRMQVSSGNLRPSLVNKVIPGFEYVYEVYAENGAYLRCTETHRFIRTEMDKHGIALYRLRVGDKVLTKVNGVRELSKIVFISPKSEKKENVRTLDLIGEHIYLAGEYRAFGWKQKINDILNNLCGRKKKEAIFYCHNLKYYDDIYIV